MYVHKLQAADFTCTFFCVFWNYIAAYIQLYGYVEVLQSLHMEGVKFECNWNWLRADIEYQYTIVCGSTVIDKWKRLLNAKIYQLLF